MPRTRDLFLVGVIILFFVMAIGVTWWQQQGQFAQVTPQTLALALDSIESVGSTTVVLVNAREAARPERLAKMREAVASELGTIPSVPETASSPLPTDEVTDTNSDSGELQQEEVVVDQNIATQSGVYRCNNYRVAGPAWSASGIRFQESEGVRVVYREITMPDVGTSTEPLQTREVLVQLPLRSLPLPTPSCLPTEVVGIAQDGSLIKTSEFALYGVFGQETIVGYALDGFPIYGTNPSVVTDQCGGVVEAGQYRYYLSAERENLLNCFAGVPVKL